MVGRLDALGCGKAATRKLVFWILRSRKQRSIVIVLLLLHSAVDFPLRTAALTVLFAIACAYLIPGRKIDLVGLFRTYSSRVGLYPYMSLYVVVNLAFVI